MLSHRTFPDTSVVVPAPTIGSPGNEGVSWVMFRVSVTLMVQLNVLYDSSTYPP